ncbi:hypothetical protein JXD38_12075 [candidate division WOR-3 bacterium]|nr:hypothetical protein [candidate division WOR-3 bacterium]
MPNLTKRDGTKQPFQREKAENALRRVGAADAIVKSTLDKVVPNEGETTSSYRNRLLAELKTAAPGTAGRYEATRRLQLQKADEVGEGTAWVNPTTARYYGWKPGDALNVINGENTLKVTVQEAAKAGERNVLLNPKAIGSLGATEGTRVSLSRQQ